jgi:DNA-binding response OmpR family regulator
MKDILTEQGYQVLIARNGKEALENIEKVLPDAMILDLMLPEEVQQQVLKQQAQNSSHILEY